MQPKTEELNPNEICKVDNFQLWIKKMPSWLLEEDFESRIVDREWFFWQEQSTTRVSWSEDLMGVKGRIADKYCQVFLCVTGVFTFCLAVTLWLFRNPTLTHLTRSTTPDAQTFSTGLNAHDTGMLELMSNQTFIIV